MVKRHLIRLNSPKAWPVKRKGLRFITRSNPGAHSLKTSMPLNLIIKDMLKLAPTTQEVRKILQNKEVMVNKVVRRDKKFPVGFMDVVELPKIKVAYRMLYNKSGKFMLKEIDVKEAAVRPCQIKNKSITKKGKVQLHLNDGSNWLVDNKDYKVNDTVVLNTQDKKIVGHLPFEKGSIIIIMGGNKVATLGVLKGIRSFKSSQPDDVIFTNKDGEFETKKKYAMVIGKEKPVIELED
ncbi:MAG: 30S ribosomal protein S4e [Candidatus Woesearchaeota archaeon]